MSLASEQTLLQDTMSRIDGLKDIRPPIIICNEEHRFLVAEQCREINVSPADIILEPEGRNTAPALCLAAMRILEKQDDIILVMPADHIVKDKKAFMEAVQQAASLAGQGKLVTFGVVPVSPETGYGYIKKGKNNQVERFVEKPDKETAKRYFESGEYLWNSGMFVFLASLWLDQMEKFRPDILTACREAYKKVKQDRDFLRVGGDAFKACPSDSIDYAVMEKTDKAAVVPLDAGWSDVGAWSSLMDVLPSDKNGNVISGDVITHETRDSFIHSEHRLVAVAGVENVVVVETADAVLVTNKENAQDVRLIVNKLDQEKREEIHFHRRVYRPWGHYEGVDKGDTFQVKRITVKPGAALSLQKHEQRAEHWIVVAGEATVTRGEEVITILENQSTFIPIGMKHRLENRGKKPLEIIEVQSGEYLGKDDITRFDDDDGRA